MNGFLNLLKPPGMTSSDAVVQIRRTLSGEKVGHAGTLDPEAAGVLPIMIGKASRLFDVLVDKQKSYVAEIALGVSTDTQDADGAALRRSPLRPDADTIAKAAAHFIGDIMQTPPAYSALKINGRTAYDIARSGETPQIEARPAQVQRIELMEMRPPDGAILHIDCGKGVYVRTLCHDIGEHLGCGAHMRFLLRTCSGFFSIEEAVTLEEWQTAVDHSALLLPMDAPLAHLPMARVAAQREADCRNGKPLACFEHIDEGARQGGPVRIYCGERFAGLARWREDALRLYAMLLE